MELVVSEIKALEPVKFNFEDLKKELTEKVSNYKNLVYTEETIQLAKTDRANFNKLSKAINDEKKRVKNLLLEPYTEFERQCKELMAIVDEVSANIDKQIKNYEEKEKNEKLQEIVEIFATKIGEYAGVIDFDKIFNESWLNKSYTYKKIEADIEHIVARTKNDLMTIDGQIKNETINKQVKDYYFNNIGNTSILSESLREGVRIIESSKKIDKLNQIATSNNSISKNNNTVENEELQILDFRVHVTQRQKFALKEFLKTSGIKFEPVPKQ